MNEKRHKRLWCIQCPYNIYNIWIKRSHPLDWLVTFHTFISINYNQHY